MEPANVLLLNKIHDKLEMVDQKLDTYSERLIKVETEHGFIKSGMKWLLAIASTILTYVIAKLTGLRID